MRTIKKRINEILSHAASHLRVASCATAEGRALRMVLCSGQTLPEAQQAPILLVDADPVSQRQIVEALAPLAVRVEVAESEGAALAILGERSFALVVIALPMLVEASTVLHRAVLFIHVRSSLSPALERSGHDYLTRPIHPEISRTIVKARVTQSL